MKTKMTLGTLVLSACAVLDVVAARISLEWNATYDTDVPQEVEIDLAKLAHAEAKGGFAVLAQTPTGEQELPVTLLPGRQAGRVALRFRVPAGTTALACETDRAANPVADANATDNLFVGALASDAVAKWKKDSADLSIVAEANGLLMSNAAPTSGFWATYEVTVPPEAAGRPVRLELDVTSKSKMTWGGFIRIRQFDAAGKELPEPVVDPRWTSHMRPPEKLTCYRENGRLHPDAKRVKVCIELRSANTSYDNHGLPLADAAAPKAKLLVSHLVLRSGAELPFPKYDDACFAAGVSGAAHDTALVLGGEAARGFFYATRSMASWTSMQEVRKEEQAFFPSGDGTVEAWFRPESWPAKGTVTLIEGSHHNLPQFSPRNTRGQLVALEYLPAEKRLAFLLKDMADKTFTGAAKVDLPTGKWTHLALQWAAGKAAELFIDGKKVASVALAKFKTLNLAKAEHPNNEHVSECFLGGGYLNLRQLETPTLPHRPIFNGVVDLWRVSTGARYAGDFTPAKTLAVDAATRALFAFDRAFDGVSGGGSRFISGSYRAMTDRVDHTLAVGGRKVQYYPAEINADVDPYKVLDINNYPDLPDAAAFKAARMTETKRATLAPGGTLDIDVADEAYMDFIELANVSDRTLRYPIVLNTGDIDPRSFGDLADTMNLESVSDRDRANRIFQYVLRASDYFMNHSLTFATDSDAPNNVEYQALTMLNAYCGFECGPLNNMTANLFACVGGCPSSQTAGYGHSFEQVFYDGKNHIYDLSAQKFFPAMDNETSEHLGEAEEQPGSFHRIGANPDHFLREGGRRTTTVQSPAYREKVAMSLRPGERFRVWFDNDGQCNDLQCNGVVERSTHMPRENYDAQTHAAAKSWHVYRVNRFFPHYGNGFIVYEGRPDAANPAFTRVAADGVTYRVDSCYPIVAARYAATRADGSSVPMQICTDGKTWRDLPDGLLTYPVRGRRAYSVRACAAVADIATFKATTEVQVNVRIFPGRLRTGVNTLTLKAADGGPTRLTVQWRRAAKPIEIAGGVYSGTIRGAERQLAVLDPKQGPLSLAVSGVSAGAKAVSYGGVSATLASGKLSIAPQDGFTGFTAVDVVDGEAVKQLTVLVCPGARLVTAEAFRLEGGAHLLPAGSDRVQPCVMLTNANDVATATFAPIPAGRWTLMTLDRFESHPKTPRDPGLSVNLPKRKTATSCGFPVNDAANFYKAQYGRKGERANFKWDFPYLASTKYYTHMMDIFDAPEGLTSLRFTGAQQPAGAELAAVLLTPYVDEEFYCNLQKVLAGLNCQPWRVGR